MSAHSKNIVVNDLLLAYSVSVSEGPTILYLHGWGDNKDTFSKISEGLGVTYKHVLLDLPGFGGSQAPQETWGLEQYSTLIATFVEKLSLSPTIIIGHSNGGAVALYGLAHETFSAEKLILLASAGVRNTEQTRKQILKSIAKTAKIATKALPKKTQTKLKNKAYKAIGSELHLVPGMEDTFKEIVAYDVSDDATKIAIPTLLIYGDSDESTPVSYGQRLTDLIPYSKLIILPHVGHMLHHEEPNDVIKHIKEFI